MSAVFLIGYMCSGKTTLGRALARVLGVPFVDLDEHVEAMAGMPIRDIFAQQGEEAFRRLERQALEAVSADKAIVACGGGTPCRPGAMEWINSHGLSVYLRPAAERLVQRLMDGRAQRPLIAGIDTPEQMAAFAQEMLGKREPYYRQAHFTFDSSRLENQEEINQSVNQFIAEILPQWA